MFLFDIQLAFVWRCINLVLVANPSTGLDVHSYVILHELGEVKIIMLLAERLWYVKEYFLKQDIIHGVLGLSIQMITVAFGV